MSERLTPATDLFRADANTPEIAANVAKWVDELLTTDRPQTVGSLCRLEELKGLKRAVGECCLGVWCRVADVPYEDIDGHRVYEDEYSFLPPSQVEALGLRDHRGTYGEDDALFALNDDDKCTFKEIGLFIYDSWLAQFGAEISLSEEGRTALAKAKGEQS